MGQMDLSTTPLACLRRDQPAETGSEVLEMANDFTRVAGTNTWADDVPVRCQPGGNLARHLPAGP